MQSQQSPSEPPQTSKPPLKPEAKFTLWGLAILALWLFFKTDDSPGIVIFFSIIAIIMGWLLISKTQKLPVILQEIGISESNRAKTGKIVAGIATFAMLLSFDGLWTLHKEEALAKRVASEKRLVDEKVRIEAIENGKRAEIEKQKAAEIEKQKAAEELAKFPKSQLEFIQLFKKFDEESENAGFGNDLQMVKIRKARKAALQNTFASMKFQNWLLSVHEISTNDAGNAAISFGIDGSDGEYFLDTGKKGKDLIPDYSPLYKVLSELNIGDEVVASGSFRGGNDHQDFFIPGIEDRYNFNNSITLIRLSTLRKR